MSCRFVVTNRVSYVSENGQIVCTEGNNIYYLRGGFSWTTFCALYPMLLINSPPPGIVDAFSNGFPAHNWRSWTQGLHYFISTASEGIKESVVISSGVQPINMPSPICADRLPKVIHCLLSSLVIVSYFVLSLLVNGSIRFSFPNNSLQKFVSTSLPFPK